MSTHENVKLKVRPTPSSGKGWHNTKASNGQTYSFRYEGGLDDQGNMKTKLGEGTATLNLDLAGEDRYSVENVKFEHDPTHQLSWKRDAESSVTITDINTRELDAHYTVDVLDAGAGHVIVPCDPMIGNDPRPPRIFHTNA